MSTPLLVMPPALRVGDTWLADNSGVSRVDGQPDVTFTLNTTYEATRSDAVEVPAGTYEVIELRTTTPESTFTYWVERDIELTVEAPRIQAPRANAAVP